jgi:hypothetical protein
VGNEVKGERGREEEERGGKSNNLLHVCSQKRRRVEQTNLLLEKLVDGFVIFTRKCRVDLVVTAHD